MNTILWILQIFLAIVFLYSGICKATQKEDWLVRRGQTGVEGLPIASIRFIGITEIIGVVGLILPMAINTLPILTPIAAMCFAAIMVPAAIIHFKRGEIKTVIFVNIFIFIICVIVTWGRFNDLL